MESSRGIPKLHLVQKYETHPPCLQKFADTNIAFRSLGFYAAFLLRQMQHLLKIKMDWDGVITAIQFWNPKWDGFCIGDTDMYILDCEVKAIFSCTHAKEGRIHLEDIEATPESTAAFLKVNVQDLHIQESDGKRQKMQLIPLSDLMKLYEKGNEMAGIMALFGHTTWSTGTSLIDIRVHRLLELMKERKDILPLVLTQTKQGMSDIVEGKSRRLLGCPTLIQIWAHLTFRSLAVPTATKSKDHSFMVKYISQKFKPTEGSIIEKYKRMDVNQIAWSIIGSEESGEEASGHRTKRAKGE